MFQLYNTIANSRPAGSRMRQLNPSCTVQVLGMGPRTHGWGYLCREATSVSNVDTTTPTCTSRLSDGGTIVVGTARHQDPSFLHRHPHHHRRRRLLHLLACWPCWNCRTARDLC